MKSVLISIQPKWCELIASGKKTIEVRKTRPKLKTPFKCYIYCTQKPFFFYKSEVTGKLILAPMQYRNSIVRNNHYELNGKVIGEFVCKSVLPISVTYSDPNNKIALREFPYTCLSDKGIMDYLGNGKQGWGWHISNLVIYDKPKELSRFIIADKEALKQCEYRERVYQNPDYVNGAWLFGGYVCNKGEIDWCSDCKRKPLKRPPQSWCYVEELKG